MRQSTLEAAQQLMRDADTRSAPLLASLQQDQRSGGDGAEGR